MSAAATERRRLYYSGHVQGVGFRYTARKIAQGFPVTGFVHNLRDGRVELVAEGEPAAIEQFLEALAKRMSGNIDHVQSQREAATGEWTAFEIAH
jgi:acylphosphatase